MVPMTTQQLKLRVVLLTGEHGWVAQCLEFDIGAQGKSIPETLRALVQNFIGQAIVDANSGRVPFADFKPAPAWYVEKYDEAVGTDLAQQLSLVAPAELLKDASSPTLRAVADVRIAA